MAGKVKRSPRKKAQPRRFHIQLGWGGMAGVCVVCFCLFLWMFLLGVWAGQTILLPAPGVKQVNAVGGERQGRSAAVREIRPEGKKRAVTDSN